MPLFAKTRLAFFFVESRNEMLCEVKKELRAPMSPQTSSCAQCGRPLPSPAGFHPFCSLRCKEVDLYRWLDEDYRIETHSESAPVPEEIVEEGASISDDPYFPGLRVDFHE